MSMFLAPGQVLGAGRLDKEEWVLRWRVKGLRGGVGRSSGDELLMLTFASVSLGTLGPN